MAFYLKKYTDVSPALATPLLLYSRIYSPTLASDICFLGKPSELLLFIDSGPKVL
jgi:hypothetical protein